MQKQYTKLCFHLPKRFFCSSHTKYLKKLKWNEIKNKKFGSDFALENFDEFYKPVFANRWPGIRLGLLTVHKYCAFVNNYGDIEQSVSDLEERGAKDVRHMYNNRLRQLLNDKPELLDAGSIVAGTLMAGDNLADTTEEVDDVIEKNDVEEGDKDDFSNRFTSRDLNTGSGSFQEFVPATQLKGMEDWVDESNYTNAYNERATMNFSRVKDAPVDLPMAWRIHTYRTGDINTFLPPKTGLMDVLNYYLMDAASVLPVFALNPKNGDHILDMCSAPGGKALSMLQTLMDVRLTCSDISLSRCNRLQNVLRSYIPKWAMQKNHIEIRSHDGRDYAGESEAYDKVLCDVPCTNDRLSVTDNENNIFSLNRVKERVSLPELQTQLLCAALTAVKRGGYVVYSTCSLSPVQNDGVVHVALQQMWETSRSNFVVHDLTDRFFPFGHLFEFHPSPRYGQLVVPSTPRNFGPMYIAKISKI